MGFDHRGGRGLEDGGNKIAKSKTFQWVKNYSIQMMAVPDQFQN